MAFVMHFYIIFGTNLLTGGLVQTAFFCLFQCFPEKDYQRSPNRMKPSGESFLEQTQSRSLRVEVKEATRRPRGWRARPGGRRAPCLVASSLIA